MIPEKTKEQIKQEELFRREVRLALEKQNEQQTRKQKFWAFLHTPLGIWFLSTIVLGVFTFGYSWFSDWRKINERNLVIIRKLDTEIKSRLYYVASQANSDGELDLASFSKVLLSFEEPEHEEYPIGVFVEYKKRNMKSLLWELHALLPEDAKPEIDKALEIAFKLGTIYEVYKKNNPTISIEFDEQSSYGEEYGMSKEDRTAIKDYIENTTISSNVYKQFASFNLERWDYPFTKSKSIFKDMPVIVRE